MGPRVRKVRGRTRGSWELGKFRVPRSPRTVKGRTRGSWEFGILLHSPTIIGAVTVSIQTWDGDRGELSYSSGRRTWIHQARIVDIGAHEMRMLPALEFLLRALEKRRYTEETTWPKCIWRHT